MSKVIKQVGAGAAALALVFALAGTASAETVWATVTGHAASTAENNNPDFWETGDIEECFKLNTGEGDLGDDQATYELGASYELVIVKAGSSANLGDNALTLFANASAGETVWADSNGNNVFDEGDKNISHIIFCDEFEQSTSETTTESTTEETTESTSSTTSFSQSVSETTDITQPPTDTIGGGSGQQSSGTWLLVAALGVLLGSVMVLAPSRAKARE
jgi:hypothetical protein